MKVSETSEPLPAASLNTGWGLLILGPLLFFVAGAVTSLNDILIPRFMDLFTLGHGQAMLVQTAFFGAYFFVAVPAALWLKKVGYMRAALTAVLAVLVGCLLFMAAALGANEFTPFLFALLVLAIGITIIQVVASPLVLFLGDAKTASSRLTMAQAFFSLGAMIFPVIGSMLLLGSDPADTKPVLGIYGGMAVSLVLVAAFVGFQRNRLRGEQHEAGTLFQSFDLMKRRRFALGAAAIFLYVGAEVTIGSMMVNFLRQDDVMAISAQAAGQFLPFYWGGALAGRFIGTAALRHIRPAYALIAVALGAVLLLGVAAFLSGPMAGYAFVAVGLMNAIMFPTIFSLACEGLGARTAEGSGLMCMAICGGAVVPPLAGLLADNSGQITTAFILPVLCYLFIMLFGFYGRKPA